MSQSHLYDPIQILFGSDQSVVEDAVLIVDGQIKAFGEEARSKGGHLGLPSKSAKRLLLAPCLVDPHSVLEEPLTGRNETLASLRNAAAKAGYGLIALLPRSSSWRDRPDRLQGFENHQSDVVIALWGSFSRNGEQNELASHADLLQHGAVGLAEDESLLPISLLKRGLVLGEMKAAPLLLAPKNEEIQGAGIVREGVETLRAGWPPDPEASETFPLEQLLELNRQHPEASIRLMNISTAKGIAKLRSCINRPMATVCWWHLVADSSLLSPTDLGWRVTPSLGGPKDRKELTEALREGILAAVSVHAVPLDEEDIQQPPDQRLPGLAGHQLILPSLWQELVVNSGWPVEKLWDSLSFGPSKMLNIPPEHLSCGSRRWLIFDPDKAWTQDRHAFDSPAAANQPWQNCELRGKVIDCGLRN